jgi:23S rRNA (uracil1939-C5)-methyltransferase
LAVDANIRASVARTLAQLDVIDVVVEKLIAGGEGLARVDGAPLFIPLAAPGDKLRVRVVERHPDYGRARIVEILAPGPGRRDPPCPHFERCGGCDLQHLEDELQTQLKAQAAIETLRRLGRLESLPEALLVRGRAWGYRLRTQVRTEVIDGHVLVGYFERGSHTLVPIRVCPILLPDLEATATGLPAVLGEDAPRRIDLALGEHAAITSAPPIAALAGGSVERRVGGFTYAYDARVFFQGHAGLVGDLQREVCGRSRGELAVDLYAGVGLFTLPLASRYRKVIAVESDRMAARFLARNARANGCANVETVSLSVEAWARSMPEGIDRLVVDPPRSGLPRALRRALVDARVPRITYASCHPATLARDMRDLAEGYTIIRLTLLDLFPQTGHLETVIELEAKPKEPGTVRAGETTKRDERVSAPAASDARQRPRPTDRSYGPPRDRDRSGPTGRREGPPRDRERPRNSDRPRPPARPRPAGGPRDEGPDRRPPRDRPRGPRTKR